LRSSVPWILSLERDCGTAKPGVEAYAAETGLKLEPRVIEQHSPLPDGLARDWPRHDAGIEKHEAYALQWYSLAALAVVLAVVLSFRKT
jgi:cytochrome oxidase assembly protein ShyY1